MAEVVILQGAQSDLVQITIRFEERYEKALTKAFDQLELFPESAPLFLKTRKIRRILVQGSHLGIFYTVVGKRVLVLAVIDIRRNPEWITDRLTSP